MTLTSKHTVAFGHEPRDGKFGTGRISKPSLALVNVTRRPLTSAGTTPPGRPGVRLEVRVPLVKVPASQLAVDVQTSTWTRLAPTGKLTRMFPRNSTGSVKKSGSMSVRLNSLRYEVPVFCN